MRQTVFSPLILIFCIVAACGSEPEDGTVQSDVAGPDVPDGESTGGSAGDGEGGSSGSGGSDGADNGGAAGDTGAQDGGDGEQTAAEIAVTPLEDLPAVFAGAVCTALLDCVGEAKLSSLLNAENCANALTAELVAREFAHMGASIDAGRVSYDPETLPDCVDAIKDQGCDVLSYQLPETCQSALTGMVEDGAACAIDSDCMPGSYCAGTDSCPSACAPLLAEGLSCQRSSECSDGLMCTDGLCWRPSAAGDSCSGTTGLVCALGLNCRGATRTVAGSCVTNAESQVGELDDTCAPDGDLCKEGLSCIYDGAAGFHCQNPVDSGAACFLGLPGQCPAGEYCDAADVTTEGSCLSLPDAGSVCVLNGSCSATNVCVPDGSGAVCASIEDNGGSCAADRACRSGNCDGGSCAAPPVCL